MLVRRVVVAVAVVTGAASLSFGSTAGAAVARANGGDDITAPIILPKTPLPEAIAFVDGALTSRMTDLFGLQAKVAGAKSLTASDRAALDSVITNATTGMDALLTKVPADMTLAAVRADAATMVLDYHVFALVTPQVNEVIANDRQVLRLSELDAQAPAIAAAIAAASQAHENVSRERVLQASFRSHLAVLSSLVSTLSAEILSIGPSSVPGSLPTLSAASGLTVRASVAADAASVAEQRIVALLARPGAKIASVLRHGTKAGHASA